MEIQQVLQFWFGHSIDSATASSQAHLWWRKRPEVDQQIREDFADGLRDLTRGKYRDWLQTARGRLAAIIVLDQFSRNMYRDKPQAFAQDALARNGVWRVLRQRLICSLSLSREYFFICLWSTPKTCRCKILPAASSPNYWTR